jgi:hypothetical protein
MLDQSTGENVTNGENTNWSYFSFRNLKKVHALPCLEMNVCSYLVRKTDWSGISRRKFCVGVNFVLAKNFMSQTGMKKTNTIQRENKHVPVSKFRAGRRKIRELRVK